MRGSSTNRKFYENSSLESFKNRLDKCWLWVELWKSLQFHTCCEPCNLFSPFVLHRTAAGFSYKSFVYPDWASIFNLGADSATEEPYTVLLSLKISLDLLFHHLSIWLVSTTCYSFCTSEKFQPFPFCAFFLFSSLPVPEDASSAGFYLPGGCLPQSPFLSYCWAVSEEDERMYVLRSEFWGV